MISPCFSVGGMDTWQWILLGLLLLLAANYIVRMGMDRLTVPLSSDLEIEGFEGEGGTAATASKHEWLTTEDLYDDFYASVYNKIFQHDALVQAEAIVCLQEWSKNMDKKDMRVLDAACGTGVATCLFAKQDVGMVTGIDKSPAMIRAARSTVLPATTLTPVQRERVRFKESDLYGPMAAGGAEFTHACLLYFGAYEFRDLSALLKNLAFWVQPGGGLVIEVVNKYKFEPIPDVANPWVAVSPQKYSKDRIVKSKAVFDKFDYETEFDLEDPRGEFRETFRFKDGSVRRQKHVLWMPGISEIVQKAREAGWNYKKFMDLQFTGFNYGYLLFFNRSMTA
jgi:SAM-dependent methyltransferase